MELDKSRSYLSPRWSGEILDCSMPMTFDQYDHCSYNCLYCFSYYQKALKAFNPIFPNQVGTHYQSNPVRPVSLRSVKRIFRFEAGKSGAQFHDYVRARYAMQWGGLSDPFDNYEREFRIGLKLLRFFRKLEYPICFSTKGTWWTKDPEYVKLFTGATFWNTKFSIITLDEKLSRGVELGCPSPISRLEAMRRVAGMGAGGVTLRLRPFIIGMSDDSYLDLIGEASSRGATALSTEFFCLEGRMNEGVRKRYERMSRVIGLDVLDFYKRNSSSSSGYMRLNWRIKEKYITRMKRACDKYGMRFYVSDAHWKDQCANGSCCGLGKEWNYFRGQFTNALLIAKNRKSGLVYWRDVDKNGRMDMFKKFLWRHATGFNTTGTRMRCTRYGQTMYDYILEAWNSPGSDKSPYRYFYGLLQPEKVDGDGNVVYKYVPYATR